MSNVTGIGYIFGNAGHRQLLTESGFYAPAIVTIILTGKDFNRGLTTLKLVDGA
jgi:hypothetical protein